MFYGFLYGRIMRKFSYLVRWTVILTAFILMTALWVYGDHDRPCEPLSALPWLVCHLK